MQASFRPRRTLKASPVPGFLCCWRHLRHGFDTFSGGENAPEPRERGCMRPMYRLLIGAAAAMLPLLAARCKTRADDNSRLAAGIGDYDGSDHRLELSDIDQSGTAASARSDSVRGRPRSGSPGPPMATRHLRANDLTPLSDAGPPAEATLR